MASLTHVCVWSKNGWKRITPEEVAREHSRGGVSARSGIFMCSLCGQYVTFFNGRVQAPHFRHSSAEADQMHCFPQNNLYRRQHTLRTGRL